MHSLVLFGSPAQSMQDQRSMLAIAWVKRKVSRQLHIIDNTDLSFSWCNTPVA